MLILLLLLKSSRQTRTKSCLPGQWLPKEMMNIEILGLKLLNFPPDHFLKCPYLRERKINLENIDLFGMREEKDSEDVLRKVCVIAQVTQALCKNSSIH